MAEPCMSCGDNRRAPAPDRCLHPANHAASDGWATWAGHCQHCPGRDDPRHEDRVWRAAERACSWYEVPEHLC